MAGASGAEPSRPTTRGAGASDRFAQLRDADAGEAPNHLVLATLRIRIPPQIGIGSFSRKHASLRIEAMNLSEVSDELSVSDYWIGGPPVEDWTREIAALPDVRHVDRLADLGAGAIYRITHLKPPIVRLYSKLAIPLQFPLRIRAGFIFWEVAAREDDYRRIVAYARKADPDTTTLAIRRRPLRAHHPELTEVQHDLLARAMAEGYFAVPRSITLTALAEKVGRSKSSVSESLALIEKKLLETALRTPPRLA